MAESHMCPHPSPLTRLLAHFAKNGEATSFTLAETPYGKVEVNITTHLDRRIVAIGITNENMTGELRYHKTNGSLTIQNTLKDAGAGSKKTALLVDNADGIRLSLERFIAERLDLALFV